MGNILLEAIHELREGKYLKEDSCEDKRVFDNITFCNFFEDNTPQEIINLYGDKLHDRNIVLIRADNIEPENIILTLIDSDNNEYDGELAYKDLWIEDEPLF